MDLRLIAFDLDGTLLRSDKSISPRTMHALHAAQERGVLLVPATGRLYRSLPEALLDEQLSRYFILVNGAQVYDSLESRTLLREELPPELALPMLQFLKTRNVVRGVYIDGLGHMSLSDYEEIDDVAATPATSALMRRSYQADENLEELTQNAASIQKIIAFFRNPSEKQPVLREIAAVSRAMRCPHRSATTLKSTPNTPPKETRCAFCAGSSASIRRSAWRSATAQTTIRCSARQGSAWQWETPRKRCSPAPTRSRRRTTKTVWRR